MKTKLLFKITTILILIHQLSILNSFAQEVPFTPPLNNSSNLTIRGDMKIIANAITGLSGDQSATGNPFFSGDTTNYNPNDPYNGASYNDRLTLDYIDIDSDAATFSSSSADFISGADCPKVAYAGLYWSATYYIDRVDAANGNNSPQLDNLPVVDSRPDFKTIKLKLPGTSNYIDINAELGNEGVIFDGYRNTPTNPNDSAAKDIPYVCYADVTEELKALANPDGTYTVANVRATTGLTAAGNGISSGWVMVIIYENTLSTRKYFNTQHGFLEIACENAFELAINNGELTGQGFSHTDNVFDPGNVPLPDYPSGLTGDLVLVDDDDVQSGAGTTDDGCQALVNIAEVNGKIAVLRRGACSFTQKIINAQNAGAIGVVVVNNNGGNDATAMSGGDEAILIPAVMIGNQNGDIIIDEIIKEEALGNSISVTLINNAISGCANPPETFTYTGFQTPPAPNDVRARFGVAALEGDFGIVGDGLAIKAVPLGGFEIPLSADPVNTATNFFNSSISVDGIYNTARNPNSQNTLGFDVDIFDVSNTGNSHIANNQSAIDFIASTEGDRYSIFLNTLSIEVVEPELTGFSRVLDVDGIDITGGNLQFGQEFFYDFTIQNTGNENLTSVSFTSTIADNLDFVQGTLVTPDGVTAIYNDANREVVFTFDDSVVERLGSELSFRFGVKVVDSCQDLRDTCKGDIDNTLLISYTGQVSGITASETELSEPASCSLTLPAPPNFLDTSGDCDQEFSALICSGTVDIVAESGFAQYIWTDLSTNIVIATVQTLTVSGPGMYKVDKTGNPDCFDQTEIWTVNDFSSVENPVIVIVNDPLVNGNIETCSITGEFLPEIFLCGSGTEQYIDSGFINTTSTIWERLDPAACPAVIREDGCPTLDIACDPDWVQVGTTRDFTVAEAGEYRIRVEYETGCAQDFYFNVFKSNYDFNLEVTQNITCDAEGAISVVNASGDYEYQLTTPQGTIVPYQASPEFTGLIEEGEYLINARQSNGLPTACVFQANVVLENLVSVVSIDVVNPTCIVDGTDNFGSIQIQVAEGQPSYTYNISSTTTAFTATEGPTTSSDHIFTDLNPDTYDVEVVSFDGDCVDSQQVTILPGGSIEADVTPLDASCNGDQTSIEVSVTTGTPPFTYILDGTTIIGPTDQTSITFNNVVAGNHSVDISDTNSCAGVFEITTSEPDHILGSVLTTPVICSGGILSMGSVIVENVTGGTVNAIGYTYTLYNSDDTLVASASPIITLIDNVTFSDVDFGMYYVTIEDENGCAYRTNTVTISSPPDDLLIVFDANASSCNIEGVVYDIAIDNGTPPYEIRIVEEPGSLGTFVSTNGLGTSPGLPFVEISGIGGNLHKTTGLSFGVPYTFEIRDGGGCVYRETVSSQSNGLSSSVSKDVTAINEGAISCDNPETIIVSVNRTTGNTNGFQFDLLPIGGPDVQLIPEDPSGTTTATFNLSSVGNYNFRITDLDTGCSIDTASYEVLPFETIAVSTTLTTDILCFGDNSGEINIEITGYIGTYNYTVTNTSTAVAVATGTENTINPLSISGLSVGTFEVLIESLDSPFCDQTSIPITISQPDSLVLNLIDTTAPNCNNPLSIVTMEATGGVGPYSYAYAVGVLPQAEPTTFPEPTIFDLDPSVSLDWVVFVRDGNGCISSSEITIPSVTTIPEITSIPSFIDDPCIFDNNYTFTVIAKSNVVAPPGTGSLSFQLNGNTPVQGNISNTEHQFVVTSPGTYTVTVFDENGCSSNQETIIVYEEVILDAQTTLDPTCIGDNGEITVTVSGGSDYTVNPGNFTFSLIDAITNTVIASQQQSNIFTNVAVGNYTIEVVDAAISSVPGCVFTDTLTISAPSFITADVAITQEYVCSSEGIQFGEIAVMNPIGGNGNYEYSIDGVDFSNTIGIFTGLTSGTYSIFIRDTDTASCPINIGTITIDPIQEISIDSITTTDGLCNGDTGSVQFIVSGIDLTRETYTYLLTGDNVPPIIGNNVTINAITIANLFPDVYNIKVTNDNTGCSYDDTFVINESSPIQANITSLEEINCENAEALVMVDVSGGTPPYEFSIDNVNYNPSNTLTFAEGGIYTAYVRDSNGCIVTLNVTIMESSDLEVALDLSNTEIICYGQATGSIDAMVTGGTDNYLYNVSGTNYLGEQVNNGPQSTSFIRNLLAGEYTYTATNGSCSESVPFTIIQPSDFVISIEQEDVTTCNGIENGLITVIATGGTAPYFYSLYDNGGNPIFTFLEDDIDGIAGQHIFDSLVPGIYRVETEDSNGCPETVSDIVISQSVVDIALSVIPVSTNDDGIIEVTASGGIGGYTYELLDATGDSVIIPSQNSNILIVNTAGNYIVKVIDSNGCFYFKEVTVETTEDNPIVEYADEILFCALTGQSYPVINIENENGEVVDLSFTNVASILWQQLDEINCNVSFEENCPTIDDSCSSDWFDFQTGSSCTITEPGQYRVVITFNAKSGQNTKIYYFRADANLLDVEDVSISKINLYPNPANRIVNINTEVRSIRVFDMSGKIVLETTQKTFDISGLENGVYFTEIESTTGGVKIIKLLKK